MRANLLIIVAGLFVSAGTCVAQSGGKALDGSPQGISPQKPSTAKAAKRVSPNSSVSAKKTSGIGTTGVSSGALFDPYEKARKAQADFFKRQDEKEREEYQNWEKTRGQYGTGKSAPGGAGASVRFGQTSKTTGPATWDRPR